MNKSILAAALFAVALTACGKKEEPAAAAPAPAPAAAAPAAEAKPADQAAAPAAAPAADAAKPADQAAAAAGAAVADAADAAKPAVEAAKAAVEGEKKPGRSGERGERQKIAAPPPERSGPGGEDVGSGFLEVSSIQPPIGIRGRRPDVLGRGIPRPPGQSKDKQESRREAEPPRHRAPPEGIPSPPATVWSPLEGTGGSP